MQFSVPQFIDVEDKIVGPLTLRQFLTIVGGAAVLAGAYFLLPFLLFFVAAIPLALLTGLLAFFKINGRPFYFFLIHMTGYLTRPRLRTWRRDVTVPPVKARLSAEEKTRAQETRTLPRRGLKQLAYILDHAGTTTSVYQEAQEEAARRGATLESRPL